jgi:beta-fructofuranosidase
MLLLPDAWVWDSWYLAVEGRFHAFYLKASRALLDPDRRHHRASVGHAVSTDLIAWQEWPDVLVHSEGPAFDDLATWTGSVVADPGGGFRLFYTGICRRTGDRVQRIGQAISSDLATWSRVDVPPVSADARWYETEAVLGHEPWRDPWVFRDDASGAWRMLVTASTARVERGARGCIGTATSADLVTWHVERPLTPATGIHQFEVPQTVEVDGRHVLVWCMRDVDLGPQAHPPGDGGPPITGTWSAPADSPAGPFHVERAEPIRVPGAYAGRVVRDAADRPVLMAFADGTAQAAFGGYLMDPVPLGLTDRGTLQPRA